MSTGPGKGAATDGYEVVACGELVCRPVGRQRRNGKKQQKRGKPLLKPGGSESPRQTKGQAGWKSERRFGAAKDGADTVFQGTRWFLKPENEKKKKQWMEVEEGKSVEQEENVAWTLLRLKVEMGAAGRLGEGIGWGASLALGRLESASGPEVR